MSVKLVLYSLFLVSVTADIHVDQNVVDSPTAEIKDHTGKCYIEELGLFDNTEFVRAGKSCKMVKCLRNEKGQYQIKMCSYLAVEPPCYAEYPLEKSFPDCCQFEIKCLPGIPKRTTPSKI